jgi:hypothetical protein
LTKKQQFLIGLPSKLKVFSRELEWLSEILSDALTLSKIKSTETFRSFKAVANSSLISGEEREASHRTLIKYTLHFDYITLHSLFVTAYSIFENFILDFGARIEQLSESKIKIADIKSKSRGVDRTVKYLSQVHNFKNASNDNPHWRELRQFQLLRHLITHNRNKLKNSKYDNGHLIPFIEKYNGYIAKDGEFKIWEKEFMENFKTIALEYTNDLASDCCKLFKEKKTEVRS